MSDEKKPWDEQWLAEETGVYLQTEHHITPMFEAEHLMMPNLDLDEAVQARIRLASAAPELYRALKAVEWVGRAEACPECEGIDDFGKHVGIGRVHQEDCPLDAALRKAEGR